MTQAEILASIGESPTLTLEEQLQAQMHEEALKDAEEAPSEAPYIPEQAEEMCRIDLNWLAGLAMPITFKLLFPAVLMAAWALLTQSAVKVRDFSQIALGIPRGHGKTTLVKLFIVWCVLFTKKKFILIISANSNNAENILSDIVDMLSEPNICGIFGRWNAKITRDRTDCKIIDFRGRTIILMAIGAEGAIRGINLKQDRPDVMIFEDIQTKECALSKVQSDALEAWMVGTAMKAKSPNGCLFVFCGNMYPGPNSILKHLKGAPSWKKFIAGAILSNGNALWEGLRSKKELIAELDNDMELGHADIFFAEVLNDTEAGINSKVDFTLIKPWRFESYEQPQGKFIVIDPSGAKVGSDAVAIGYFEVYDGTPGLREAIEENLSPGNTIRQALLMALRRRVRVIAVEATAYQASLLYWFDFIANQLDLTGFEFVEVHTGNYAKNARIQTMLKSLTAGEILLHPTVKPLVVNQITHWNPLRRTNVDGLLDLLAYAPKVIELYGASIATEADPSNLEAQAAQVQAIEYSSAF